MEISSNTGTDHSRSVNDAQMDMDGVRQALFRLNQPIFIKKSNDRISLADDEAFQGRMAGPDTVAYLPPCPLTSLGDPSFVQDYGLKFPYLAGAMANGICSVEIVEAMSRVGMLGFFGSAGLDMVSIETAIDRLERSLGNKPYGFNLIYSPNDATWETEAANLFLKRNIRRIEASAYMEMTLPLIRYRLHGIHQAPDGRIVTPNRILAKISRIEIATKFLSPPPPEMIGELQSNGELTDQQCALAERIPVAQDITAEADSGGHTDNRPAITLIPTILALRDRMQAEHQYDIPLRVGAAGGISTPVSALAAFSMGAAYILTGTINQGAREAGTSDIVRDMLAQTAQADVTMAPAADMFEMGVKVQVIKRGTLFAMRAQKLYDLYRTCSRLEDIPQNERNKLETTIFKAPLETIWEQTKTFFQQRDPKQISRAERDPKHKMALVFRWYLGQSSNWANRGIPDRKIDYQIMCGPAMGAFNEWTRGTFLALPENREVTGMAFNLLFGAAVLSRIQMLRLQGIPVPPDWGAKPMKPEQILEYIS